MLSAVGMKSETETINGQIIDLKMDLVSDNETKHKKLEFELLKDLKNGLIW